MIQQSVGIEQRDAEGQRVQHRHAPFLAARQTASKEFCDVRRDLALKQAAIAELAQNLDGFVLRGRAFSERVQQRVPNLVDRSLPIHPSDEVEGALVDAVMTTRASVLKEVPNLAAIDVARYTHVPTQPRMQARDAIPAGAEEGVHGLPDP